MQAASPGQGQTAPELNEPPSQPFPGWYIARQLEASGYAYRKKTLKEPKRLEELLYRSKRGQFSYEKRSVAELREFCSQRKLDLPPPPKATSKQELISLLWHADDHACFDQFTQLPPELRVRIYEHMVCDSYLDASFDYLKPGHKNYAIHKQHPITRANRLLRKESLPIFYDNVCAHVCATNESSKEPCSPLLKAPDGAVSRWRNVMLLTVSLGPPDLCTYGIWDIELAGKGKEAQISYTTIASRGSEQTLLKEVEAAIREVLQKLEVHEGMAKLSRASIEELGEVVRRARARIQSREGSV